ncbi:MAG: hypothetical protein GXY05_14740 [Clostridiales bacterium]|nr:hypothetical protein [Clostridiales bacterium]
MKKTVTIILIIVVVLTLCVPALAVDNGVATLDAVGTTASVTVSGTSANGVLAVMTEVLDTDGTTSLAMKSFAVSGGSFSGVITGVTLSAGATYTVRAADYNGGTWTATTFTVPLPLPPISVSAYTLTFVTNGGNSINTLNLSGGSVVELTKYVPTREGYTFSGWYSDEALTNSVTSVTITNNMTVYAGWSWIDLFADVAEDDWFYGDVVYAYENALMKGTSDTTFDPHGTITRGMIVEILYRLENKPAVTGACPFDDVASGKYYENAATWAAANKIVDGYGNGKFGPEDAINREQMAVILYRYEQYKGGGFKGAWMFPLNFPDADKISDWAYEAMCWCTMNDIIGGNDDGTLAPQGNAERCQAAAILHRFCDNIEK